MSLTRAQKVRLGTFVLSGTSVFVVSVVMLAGLKIFERRDRYSVLFKESVGGLEASAQVKYQGLRVGRVDSMRIAPDDPGQIEVNISLDPGTALFSGTKAVLDASGLTGLKTINLVPGDPRSGLLKPGSRLEAGASFVDRITGKAEDIAIKIDVLTTQLSAFTSEQNRVRVEQLLDNLNRLTADIDTLVVESRPPLVRALEEVAKSGAALRVTSKEADETLRLVRGDLSGTLANARATLGEVNRILKAVDEGSVKETMTSAQSAMKQLDQRLSQQELGKAVEDLKTALGRLSKILEESELVVRASREDFVSSMAHIRQATEDLREFSRIVAQDPSVLIRGTEVRE